MYIALIKSDSGSGGFLCPPGHPAHEYAVKGWGSKASATRGNSPSLIAGIDYLFQNEYGDVSPELQAQARKIMDEAELACSESWVRSVYGYFRGSYSPDGTDRNVSNAVHPATACECGYQRWSAKALEIHLSESYGHRAMELPPADHHLGYLTVRKYFPGHQPRTDLIEDPGKGYGSYPCSKCGQQVQYEARKDAWCVVKVTPWSWNPDCPEGGQHEVP
jgi:hypothetical protein